MITASEARTQVLNGDPERMLIIAETKIKDAEILGGMATFVCLSFIVKVIISNWK